MFDIMTAVHPVVIELLTCVWATITSVSSNTSVMPTSSTPKDYPTLILDFHLLLLQALGYPSQLLLCHMVQQV